MVSVFRNAVLFSVCLTGVFAGGTAWAECPPGLFPLLPGSSLCDVREKTYLGEPEAGTSSPAPAAAAPGGKPSPLASTYPEIVYTTPASLRMIENLLGVANEGAPATECFNSDKAARFSCDQSDGRRVIVVAAKKETSRELAEKFCDGETSVGVTPVTTVSQVADKAADFVIVRCAEPMNAEALAEAKARMPKQVSAADLAVQSNKWKGKWVEIKLACFYADEGDVRCTGDRVRVDFSRIESKQALAHIQDKCSTIAESNSPACKLTVRFRYSGWTTMSVGIFPFTLVSAEGELAYVTPTKTTRAKN